MNDDNAKQGNVGSTNQTGGITAQNVTYNQTINHYKEWNLLSRITLLFKNKPMKWAGVSLIFLIGVGGYFTFSTGGKTFTKEEFYKFLVAYYQSVEDKNADARDYFTDNISIFYTERNITPERVNTIRKTQDFTNRQQQIDKESIKLRATSGGIDYWRFIVNMICFRPSKNKYQKCYAEMEFGINSDHKITSIEQIRYWDLKYSIEKPSW